MRLDALGVAFIRNEEGSVLYPYDDKTPKQLTRRLHWNGQAYVHEDGSTCRGYPTIGVGRRIWPGEIFGDITQEQCDAMYATTLHDFEAAVNRQIPDTTPGWNQNRYACAVSFSVNAGQLSLTKYGLTTTILEGRYDACRALFGQIIHTKGEVSTILVRRRAREWTLFCKPVEIAWGPGDIEKILASVHDTAMRDIEPFLAGDDEAPATERNT